MSFSLSSTGPIDLFSQIHNEQFLIAFAVIGAITVLVVVALVVLRRLVIITKTLALFNGLSSLTYPYTCIPLSCVYVPKERIKRVCNS